MAENKTQDKGILNGVFIAYMVLLLHVLLIIGIGFAVVLLKGMYDLRWVIITVTLVLIGGSAYFVIRRIKDLKRSLTETMNDPALRERTLEISLFGGMASMRVGHRDDNIRLIEADHTPVHQLESPATLQLRELEKLAKMLEDDLITREEFTRLKQEIVRDDKRQSIEL